MINNRDQTVMQFRIIPMVRNTSLLDFLYQSHSLATNLHFPIQVKPVSTVPLQTQSSLHLGIFTESLLISPSTDPCNDWHTVGPLQMFVARRKGQTNIKIPNLPRVQGHAQAFTSPWQHFINSGPQHSLPGLT